MMVVMVGRTTASSRSLATATAVPAESWLDNRNNTRTHEYSATTTPNTTNYSKEEYYPFRDNIQVAENATTISTAPPPLLPTTHNNNTNNGSLDHPRHQQDQPQDNNNLGSAMDDDYQYYYNEENRDGTSPHMHHRCIQSRNRSGLRHGRRTTQQVRYACSGRNNDYNHRGNPKQSVIAIVTIISFLWVVATCCISLCLSLRLVGTSLGGPDDIFEDDDENNDPEEGRTVATVESEDPGNHDESYPEAIRVVMDPDETRKRPLSQDGHDVATNGIDEDDDKDPTTEESDAHSDSEASSSQSCA